MIFSCSFAIKSNSFSHCFPQQPINAQARDEFFKCVADAGITFSLDTPIPKACLGHRKAYESTCRASWVRHFDTSQDKELRILKTLRANINQSAATASGNLSGTDHRPPTTTTTATTEE